MARIAFIIFNILISIAGSTYSNDTKTSLPSNEYFSDHNIEVVSALSGSRIQLARRRDTLLYQGFDHYVEEVKTQKKDISSTIISRREYAFPDGWKFTNFKNALKAFFSKEKDIHNAYLLISGSVKGGDTAFELSSPMIPVEAGKSYTLTFRRQLSKKLVAQRGFNGKYETGIIWLSSDNKKIDETPFSLLNEKDVYKDWHTRKIEVISPERASKAIIRFGFDLPNLGPEDFVCFDDIRLETLSTQYESEGEFISRPMFIESDNLSFTANADIPQGTSIQFQLRFTEDNNGVPGTWTSFIDHNQMTTPQSPPLQGGIHRWLQYRAVLHTTKPDTTPALHSVIINSAKGTSITDSGWSGPDTIPPEIVWRSPTRTEQADVPIAFRLCDNTGGLGVKSVEAYLDGKKVELLRSQSNENEYILETTGALKPIDRSKGFSPWQIENYQNVLAVERTPEVITVISKSKDDTYIDTAFKMKSPLIPVIENTKYVFSYSSRYNIGLADIKHWGSTSSGINWKDLNGKEIGVPYKISYAPDHLIWHRDVHKVTSPSGAVSAEICFGWDSPNLKNGEFFSVKEVSFDGPRPEVSLELNLHRVNVNATDLAGNRMHKTWYVLVKKPPTETIVTLRDDGMALINNKPFFPIGIYAVQKSKVNNYNFDNAFKELKDAGFNTAHTYMKERNNDFAEFYSTAAQYGIKVFVMTSAGHNSADIDTIVRDVATEVDQPTLLSWYLADDTSGYISPSDLKRIHEAIKDIDPYHLTSQADTAVGFANRYQRYADTTDIFLPELYPVRTKGKNEIAEVIHDMKNVQEEFVRVGCNKGVWAIVQDFKGWGWERYPTNEELRAMTYLSIIHGATGVIYYTYGGWGDNFGAPYNEHVWGYLKEVVGELAYLHDVLAERNTTEKCAAFIIKGAEKDGMGYPALNTLLKVYQGKHYLFAANSAQQAIRCQFKPATDIFSEVNALFENRSLPVKDGVFVDDFKPYDVHVYEW